MAEDHSAVGYLGGLKKLLKVLAPIRACDNRIIYNSPSQLPDDPLSCVNLRVCSESRLTLRQF
ncbi:hypothetical protein L208DRAFT_1389475, partial [Tricholoma matsutake]